MPSKIRSSDWDLHFSPKARPRGGPLAALVNILLIAGTFALLGAGFVYGSNITEQRKEQASAISATNVVLNTQVAATVYVERTATAVARTAIANPSPVPVTGSVVNGGNLRLEPVVAPETLMGQIFPGDQVLFLEERIVDGQPWYRVRVTSQTDTRGLPVGTEGWASGSLLSQPSGPIVPPWTPTPGGATTLDRR